MSPLKTEGGWKDYYLNRMEEALIKYAKQEVEKALIADRKLWDDQHALDLKLHVDQALTEAAGVAREKAHVYLDSRFLQIAKEIEALKS